MGEKSRGNWLSGWCSLKGKGCKGKCEICIRRSESTLEPQSKISVGQVRRQ